MAQIVAHELSLGVQVRQDNITVYKFHLQQHNRVQRLGGNGKNHVDEDDVHELAQHGKDGFNAELDCDVWALPQVYAVICFGDVAQLSSTAEGIADPTCEREGGAYAVQSRSSGRKLALFKPAEEENFKSEGIYPGEGAVRERAAYVLDSRSNGFSDVPPTALARLRLTNVGRLKEVAVQRFMANTIGSMESFGVPFDLQKAREFIPVEQVHRIALLDTRVFNTDRYSGNILRIGEKKPYTMVPNDHGCIFPKYPQAREALLLAAMKYVDELDAKKDATALRSLGMREECVTTLKICTLFLAVAHGMSLFWMGNFMKCDGCFQYPSRLENTIQKAYEDTGVPYTFEPDEYDEQRGEIELGVLSRRPPNDFFVALEHQLVEAIRTDNS
ncbi:hypothetical protein PsorP6_005393 [Peronosclerospora sorghi]|uniref:Uncharacterized protein n=1 Tax=Peronosclerospora sorghi TaxID=230839 RepID=A0ACC0W4H6_9STRA|nr:hypothetical protein PsorP6_005393 [Peronosclerospora sorghi]